MKAKLARFLLRHLGDPRLGEQRHAQGQPWALTEISATTRMNELAELVLRYQPASSPGGIVLDSTQMMRPMTMADVIPGNAE
jgi:hypothetical protein